MNPKKTGPIALLTSALREKAAHAKLEITYPKRVMVDYINLLKIEGEWKIVNKIFSLKPNGM